MYEENTIKSISLTGPVGNAIERTKTVLFSPFDLSKWFTIGFCAWLATLGEGGSSYNGNWGGGNTGGHDGNIDFQGIVNYIHANLIWIIPVGLGVLVILLTIGLVVSWLRCRGKFMFLYNVAQNKAEVIIPWRDYAAEANSLFVFKIALGLIGLVSLIPLAAGWYAVVMPLIRSERLVIASIGAIIALSVVSLIYIITLTVITKFTDYFVIPTMYLNRVKCFEAWKQFGALLKNNIGSFILFLLFMIVLSIATSTLVILGILGTCCIACCFLAIPFIGTVIMLPILVFMRSYTAYYLAQYGRQWDVFAPPSGPAPVTVEATPIDPDAFFRGQQQ